MFRRHATLSTFACYCITTLHKHKVGPSRVRSQYSHTQILIRIFLLDFYTTRLLPGLHSTIPLMIIN
ncbi:hypothetical protein Hanom_Chr03g00247041 [Helianthus anomalus]